MSPKWKSLLTSRKVWLALITVILGVIAFSQGALTAEQLVELVVALTAAIILAIGIEDHGLRSSGR